MMRDCTDLIIVSKKRNFLRSFKLPTYLIKTLSVVVSIMILLTIALMMVNAHDMFAKIHMGKSEAEKIMKLKKTQKELEERLATIQEQQKTILQQQEDLLELSSPVIKVWDNVVVLPVIGTLDSRRTQIMMENLLQKVVDTGCTMAILDITGVATIDTQVANHLIKTVTSARLLGAECIVSGISPAIAQTIVHLGIDLSSIQTKATLQESMRYAFQQNNQSVVETGPEEHSPHGETK